MGITHDGGKKRKWRKNKEEKPQYIIKYIHYKLQSKAKEEYKQTKNPNQNPAEFWTETTTFL